MNHGHDPFEAQNLLRKHGITGQKLFKHIGEELISNMENVELSLEHLDDKIISHGYNKTTTKLLPNLKYCTQYITLGLK